MKRQLYNLTDEPFAMFVNRVNDVFSENRINYNIVGGASVQAHLLDIMNLITQGLLVNMPQKD